MGNQTTKRTFEVPVCPTPDGILHIWPYFHRSPIFTAGGYSWSINYYPESLYDRDSIDLCLQLESEGSTVTISSSVGLLDPTGRLPRLELVEKSPPMEFDSDDESRRMVTHWVPKSKLSAVPVQYLELEINLMFEWTITVHTEMPIPAPTPTPAPELMPIPMPMPKVPATDVARTFNIVPARDMAPTPNKVPATDVAPTPKVPATDVAPTPKVPATTDVASAAKVPMTDVTFSVGGELFHAHKVILALRSSVFKAELSGGTTTETTSEAPAAIEVDDMRPHVFEVLLRYIYTDTLPTTEGQSDEDVSQMMCHLLVAADRYDLEGLKLLCEGKLSKMLDVDNVAGMLAFADDEYCTTLRDACVEFMVTSGRMVEVVASRGYQRLRMKHPLILLDVFEKSLMFPKV